MNTDKVFRNLSLLTARVALGGSIAAHGAQKMFGSFDGPGIDGVTQMMESFGFRPGEPYAQALAATELTSGALISMGALGPVGPAMLLSVMLSAVELVHKPKGFFNQNGGYELNIMFATIALLLANEGYGDYSFDALIGLHEKTGPTLGWLALAGGAATAISILSRRETPQQTQRQPDQQGRQTAETGETEAPATVS